ncbi:10091_t:CDS:2, partial [Diversispora eburnea]
MHICFTSVTVQMGIDKFHWEIIKNEKSYNNFTVQEVALFVESLRTNLVIETINQSKEFINYAVENSEQVNIVTSEAFGYLTSFMDFTTFLILADRPGYCDFCLSRSYLEDVLPDNYPSVDTASDLSERTRFNINFFVSLDRKFSQNYVPSDQDILYTRMNTTDIVETIFRLGPLAYRS